MVRNAQLYHLNTEGTYQSWLKGSLILANVVHQVVSLGMVFDYFVENDESGAITVDSDFPNSLKIYTFNPSYQISIITQYPFIYVNKIFSDKEFYYYFLVDPLATMQSYLRKIALDGTFLTGYTFPLTYNKIEQTPNMSLFLVWNEESRVKIFNKQSWMEGVTINPLSIPTSSSTEALTFSHDSTLVIK